MRETAREYTKGSISEKLMLMTKKEWSVYIVSYILVIDV